MAPISKKWFRVVRRKFHRSSHTDTIFSDSKTSPKSSSSSEETTVAGEEIFKTASFEEDNIAASPTPSSSSLKKDSTKAIKIQAFFRGHLAKPAFRAPKSVVKTSRSTIRLGKSRSCFRIAQRKSRKPSHTNNRASSSIEEASEDPTVAASSSQKTEMTIEDMAAVKIQAFFRGHLERQRFRAGDQSISTSSKKKRMGMSRNCLNIVFRRRSRRHILSPDGNIPSDSTEEAIAKEESNETEVTKETISSVNANGEVSSTPSSEKKDKIIEDIAAIKIQASFRGHLVRQTFRERETIATSSKKKRKGMPPNCFSIVQRRFRRRSSKASRSTSTEEAIVKEETIKVEDSNGAAASSSTPSSQKEELTKEDVAAVKIQAIFRGHRARRAFQSLKSLVSITRKKENRPRTVQVSRNLFDIVRRKFRKTPNRDIIFPHNNPCARISTDEATVTEETINFEDADDATPFTLSSPTKEYLTKEDVASVKIQAFFRGHLARRAYRALKSLVKLQAVARGVFARRQARIALHCMHALTRLQVRVRARQLLNGEEVV